MWLWSRANEKRVRRGEKMWQAVKRCLHCSCQQVVDDMAVHIGQAEVAALVGVGQALVINAKQMKHRRLKVVDVNGSGREIAFVRIDRIAVRVGDVV